jgi:hypothetical protein
MARVDNADVHQHLPRRLPASGREHEEVTHRDQRPEHGEWREGQVRPLRPVEIDPPQRHRDDAGRDTGEQQCVDGRRGDTTGRRRRRSRRRPIQFGDGLPTGLLLDALQPLEQVTVERADRRRCGLGAS